MQNSATWPLDRGPTSACPRVLPSLTPRIGPPVPGSRDVPRQRRHEWKPWRWPVTWPSPWFRECKGQGQEVASGEITTGSRANRLSSFCLFLCFCFVSFYLSVSAYLSHYVLLRLSLSLLPMCFITVALVLNHNHSQDNNIIEISLTGTFTVMTVRITG